MHGRRRWLQLCHSCGSGPATTSWISPAGTDCSPPKSRNRVRNYTGVDFSQPFIDLAIERTARIGATNLRFECASIEDFCAAHARRFDVACAFDFSEHVPDANGWRCSSTIRRSLKRRRTALSAHAERGIRARAHEAPQLHPAPVAGARCRARHGGEPRACSARRVLASLLARFVRHYNVLRFLHPLRHIPGLGPLVRGTNLHRGACAMSALRACVISLGQAWLATRRRDSLDYWESRYRLGMNRAPARWGSWRNSRRAS